MVTFGWVCHLATCAQVLCAVLQGDTRSHVAKAGPSPASGPCFSVSCPLTLVPCPRSVPCSPHPSLGPQSLPAPCPPLAGSRRL